MDNSDKTIRCFFGVQLESETTKTLLAIANELTDIPLAKRIKWTSAENLHITMRFLGDINPQMVRNICNNVSFALKDCKPFRISLTAPHLFPNRKRAQIVAALTQDDAELIILAKNTESALERSGFDPEQRRFRGHITLARSKSPIEDYKVLEQHERSLTAQVNNVVFYQSELTPEGAKYSIIERFEFKLGGALERA